MQPSRIRRSTPTTVSAPPKNTVKTSSAFTSSLERQSIALTSDTITRGIAVKTPSPLRYSFNNEGQSAYAVRPYPAEQPLALNHPNHKNYLHAEALQGQATDRLNIALGATRATLKSEDTSLLYKAVGETYAGRDEQMTLKEQLSPLAIPEIELETPFSNLTRPILSNRYKDAMEKTSQLAWFDRDLVSNGIAEPVDSHSLDKVIGALAVMRLNTQNPPNTASKKA